MGDIVFYHGERMFVEPPLRYFPWVRVGDHRIPRDRPIDKFSGQPIPLDDLYKNRMTYYVFADELTAVQGDYSKFAARLPTPASVARVGRLRAGVRDVDDEVAKTLRACGGDLDKVFGAAAQYLGVPVGTLREKYKHLNPGQQRMVLGNRMRAK